jgi:hypothetical protein
MTPPASASPPGSDALPADLAFPCPRCGGDATARFYGPCDSCRVALRAAYEGEAREIEVEAYVPKMNVTPNAIATKD